MKSNLKTYLLGFIVLGFLVFLYSCNAVNKTTSFKKNQKNIEEKTPSNILVFSKTNGWRHKSIPSGILALKKLGVENNWQMDFSEDSLVFNSKNLSKYKMLVFLNTTGNILGSEEEKSFKKFIHNGGSFVGIHSATDTEPNWPFYAEMIGAQFESHPKQQQAKLNVHNHKNHPAIAHFAPTFEKFDEWYNFKKPMASHINVLIDIDESSYKGKQMGTKHPISWYHTYEGARVFYTAMGHTNKTYTNPLFVKHLEEGMKWALNESEVSIKANGENLLDENLSKWDVWMGAVHPSVDIDFEKSEDVRKGKPMGLNNDPKKVFSVIKENEEPVLKITGEIYGGLTSKNEYSNYHFTTQFKWGEKKWQPRLKDKRDSGILYHATGKHGAFWNVWMASLEFQVQEGDCGDFIALGDVYGDVPAKKKTRANGKTYYEYDSKGELVPLKWQKYDSGQASKSSLYEKPNGEWNTLEIYCLDNESIHLVNGHVVNRVKNTRYDIDGKTKTITKGKIQIQSEAAEVYYKNIKISPITKFPSKFKNL
ncbi:ThuA domain-containing protein [Polaribacter staleyi]|uniref:ThuA domain-containing protein n=1 Tax=Polaribacter staleyi TaxID=2022337 RepID=UPI0031BB5493